jgi:hypothetical protein
VKKSRLAILVAIGIVLIALGIVLWSVFRPITWEENFNSKKKNPYGTYLIFELLQKSVPQSRIETIKNSNADVLRPFKGRDATFISISNRLAFNTEGMDRLFAFVAAGNNAILSTNYLSPYIRDSVLQKKCAVGKNFQLEILDAEAIYCNLVHPDLRLQKSPTFSIRNQHGIVAYPWTHFGVLADCSVEGPISQLGYLNDSLINFLRIPFGKGAFYLHSTPQAFTNYHMRRKEVLRYAEGVFAHIGRGPVFWDASEGSSPGGAASSPPPGTPLAGSPLKYILSQPALAWAWYMLLFMGLSFLVFHSKRRQRIIPVYEPNTNTSLEFVSTVGRLYFLQNNHRRLSLQQMKLFQQFVRDRYGLKIESSDKAILDKLAEKSSVPKTLLEDIFRLYNQAENSTLVPEKSMIELHRYLEEFHRNCK